MSFSTGLALFFVLFIGGLVGLFLWLWILERKEKRQTAARLKQADEWVATRRREALATVRAELAALSPDAIRARLRLGVGPVGAETEGLVICSRPVTRSVDCRLVVDGIALRGLEREARARLSEDDDALLALAISQSLGAPPTTPGAAPLAWLTVPETLLGQEPALLVGVGSEVQWIAPPTSVEAFMALRDRHASERGPLDHTLFFWDGKTLEDIRCHSPSLRGPNTPDFIFDLPPALCDLTGLPVKLSVRRSD